MGTHLTKPPRRWRPFGPANLIVVMDAVGIDVGALRLHLVAVDADARVLDAATFAAADLELVAGWLRGARTIGIDSPDRWSTAPHDGDASLAPKFRTARCGEIALGREHRVWVPWTTPIVPAPGTWMATGIALFGALRAAGHQPLEVFPHAVFRVLAGRGRLPPKRSVAGAAARCALLAAAGVEVPPARATDHDTVDAAAVALVALHHTRGTARAATCGHDGSAIWLPACSETLFGVEAPPSVVPAPRVVTTPESPCRSAAGVAEAAPSPLRAR